MDGVSAKVVTEQMLAALAGVGGAFNGAKVGLFKNNIAPNADTVLADLVTADFDGAAVSGPITWSAVVHNDSLEMRVLGSTQVFICTGDTTPNLIYGFYIVNSAGTELLYSMRYDSPQSMSEAGNFIAVTPDLRLLTDALN